MCVCVCVCVPNCLIIPLSLSLSVCVCVCVQGELKGKRGLVPSNFLEVVKEGSEEEGGGKKVRKGSRASLGMEIFAASEEDIEQAKRIIAEVS